MCDEDGKEEMFKEMIEMDDEKMAVTINGLEGHVMEELKVYVVTFHFIPTSEEGCICKVTMVWGKRPERRLSCAYQLHEVRRDDGC